MPPSNNTYPPLHLTLRFASHLPDLTLSPIRHPSQTSALSLLPEIRRNLPATHSSLRILLISSGRILPLRESLSTSLKLPSRKKLGKAPATATTTTHHSSSIQDADTLQSTTTTAITIHATFSLPETSLSTEDLLFEAAEGTALNTKLQSASTAADTVVESEAEPPPPPPATAPILLGFDRLSAPSIGIPEDDIAALRRHFRSLIAADRAGDQPPLTPMEFLVLEERWLDDDDDGHDGGGGVGSAAAPGDMSTLFYNSRSSSTDASSSHHVDDVLWGNILGFFWPLGGLFWFVRQEGAWRERRRVSVCVGVLVNLLFCVVRGMLVGGTQAAAAAAA